MDRRDFLRSAGTTTASGCLLTATGLPAAAADRPQWSRNWRIADRAAVFNRAVETAGTAGGAVFVPGRSSVADTLDESVLPTNLYEAQPRQRLRGGH